MNKNNNVFDSKQYQLILKKVKDWIHEMREDEEKQSFEMPEEWDEQFRDTIRETLIQEKRKTRKKRIRTWGIAAAAVLIIGIFCNVQTVRGDGWLEIIKNMFLVEGEQNTSFGEEEHYTFNINDIEGEASLKEESMVEICRRISVEEKVPVFCLEYIPNGYYLEESKYGSKFSLMNLQFKKGNFTIYVSQRKLDIGETFGKINDDVILTVQNDKLKQEIPIYASEQQDTYVFYVQVEDNVFSGDINDSIEECKKILENICIIKESKNED